MARQGGQRHKVVSSGRLTGSGRGQLIKKKVAGRRVAHLESGYSLYSTDSEDQVTTMHKGLDRCAALLSDILQAEKTEPKSKPTSHLPKTVLPKNKVYRGKLEAEKKRLGKKSSTVTRINKKPEQKTVLSSRSGFKGQPCFHHEPAVGAVTGSQVMPMVTSVAQVQHAQPNSFPIVCTMPGRSSSLPSTGLPCDQSRIQPPPSRIGSRIPSDGLQTSTVFNCRLTTSTPVLSPQRPTSALSQGSLKSHRGSDGELHHFTQQVAIAPTQPGTLSATVSPTQCTASISFAPAGTVSTVPILQQTSIPPDIKRIGSTSLLNTPTVGLVEQIDPLQSPLTVATQISVQEPPQVPFHVQVRPSSQQQLSSEECFSSSSEGRGDCSWKELKQLDGVDIKPVRDTSCQTSIHKTMLDHKTKAASPEKTARKVMTVKYLLGELKALVANQDIEAVRLISEVEQSISLLPTMVGSTNVQAELALALQPLRSENAQLRRRLRILNQQLQERERAERQARPVDCSLELVSLQSLNLTLQTQLNEGEKKLGILQQENQRLQKDLQDKEKELQEANEQCKMETNRIRHDVTEALAEMQNCRAKLEESEREKIALVCSLQQKEADIIRLQDITRNLPKNPASCRIIQADESRPAQLTKSALDQYEDQQETIVTDRVSDSVKAYLQTLEDTGNSCMLQSQIQVHKLSPASTGQWTGRQKSCLLHPGVDVHESLREISAHSKDKGQTTFVSLKETVKVQPTQTMCPVQCDRAANGHVGLRYLGLALEKLGIATPDQEILDDKPGRDLRSHADVGSQIEQTIVSSEQSQHVHGQRLKMLEAYAGKASNFENTVLSCSENSLASDWSVNSWSTFNTRDEQDFRTGLAALDASIASLQKTLKADLKK